MKIKSRLAAAVVAVALVFKSVAAPACCGAVGADGNTRLFWRGTNGSASLWKLDSNFNMLASVVYGPYNGYSPDFLVTVGSASNTYLMWTNTDGSASIWKLDANFNSLTSANFGPVAGWHPEGLGGDGKGNIRLVWHTPANQVTAWVLNANLQVIGASPVYGPYFGWSFQ